MPGETGGIWGLFGGQCGNIVQWKLPGIYERRLLVMESQDIASLVSQRWRRKTVGDGDGGHQGNMAHQVN